MTIDERLQFLLQSTESLHENVGKLVERVDKLAETSERHERAIQRQEREQERFRRAMRAALVAWLDEGENGDGTQQG
jgi:predicted transcriptional regulator